LHSEHLIVDGEKMSKSLGNFYTLPQLLEKGCDPRAIRQLFLSCHYRQKLNFTLPGVEAAAAALKRVDEMRYRLGEAKEEGAPDVELAAQRDKMLADFTAALEDDLGVANALAAVFVFVRQVNKAIEAGKIGEGDKERVFDALARVDTVLGVLDPEEWDAPQAGDGLSDEEIEALLTERTEARKNKDFARSDAIRDQLTEAGITIEDRPDGTRWRR
jgi:cysteinyl-tRNA synthetase